MFEWVWVSVIAMDCGSNVGSDRISRALPAPLRHPSISRIKRTLGPPPFSSWENPRENRTLLPVSDFLPSGWCAEGRVYKLSTHHAIYQEIFWFPMGNRGGWLLPKSSQIGRKRLPQKSLCYLLTAKSAFSLHEREQPPQQPWGVRSRINEGFKQIVRLFLILDWNVRDRMQGPANPRSLGLLSAGWNEKWTWNDHEASWLELAQVTHKSTF